MLRLVLPVALLSPAVAAQGLAPNQTARIDSVFQAYSPKTPGCALLVKTHGAVSYEHTYGLASLELSVPITGRTVFSLASVSKQFTAASVLLLAQSGRLSLDDDIRKYVPELPTIGGRITLRELLTHTSGWRDYIQLLVWQGHEVRDHVTSQDALRVLGEQHALNFPPGSRFAYSNTGYFLLSLVVQRVTGQSLAAFAQDHIFAPLGMWDTHWVEDARQVIADRAIGYEPDNQGSWHEAMSGWETLGDGGVYSTVEDLAKWDDNFSSGRVGGVALTDSMSTRGKLVDSVPVPYGMGLFLDQYRATRRVWHNGIWAGYRSVIMRFPDDSVTIIALCNTADARMEVIGDAVADVVLPVAPTPLPSTVSGSLSISNASDLVGLYYSVATNERVHIDADTGGLVLTGRGLRLIPTAPRTFVVATTTSTLVFRPAHGRATQVVAGNEGRHSSYERVEPALVPGTFGAYAGRYWSEELGVAWQVVVDSGHVLLRDERGNDTPLQPIFRDGFNGIGTVRFARDSSGAVAALTVTTSGVTALRFIRAQSK